MIVEQSVSLSLAGCAQRLSRARRESLGLHSLEEPGHSSAMGLRMDHDHVSTEWIKPGGPDAARPKLGSEAGSSLALFLPTPGPLAEVQSLAQGSTLPGLPRGIWTLTHSHLASPIHSDYLSTTCVSTLDDGS
jgi:hypothetical protein